MKMKKIVPLLMVSVLIATSAPLAVNASSVMESGSGVQSDEGTTTEGVDGSGTADSSTTDNSAAGNVETSDSTDGADGVDIGNGVTVTDDTTDGTADANVADSEDNADVSRNVMNAESTSRVVTLGEALSADQRTTMYQYFGVDPASVSTINVTHADEVKYMEGIATAEQIGTNTVSCAYIEPTTSGGIKVKTANLNFVTSQMIASALTTAGMENCNVVAACPFQVSGTGALTGIMMAYESASGEALDEGKKQAATEEIVLTGALADAIGEEAATEVVNEAKTEILDKGLTDPDEIGAAVDQIAENHGATLTDDQRSQIISLLQTMSQYDYDLDSIQKTLNNLNDSVGGLTKAWDSVKSFFVGNQTGIISDTDDSVLGEGVVTTSTVDDSGFKDDLITRIKNLFSGN